MFDFDKTFPRSYEVEEVGEFPGDGKFREPVYYFPRLQNGREYTGWWLRIKLLTGNSWIGVFALEYQVPPAISRIVATPDPTHVCIISAGKAHIVNTNNPDGYQQISTFPVLDVRTIQDKGLLIFSDFVKLTAYSKDGLIWESPRVCWDDLKITKITENTIEGSGYDPTSLERSRFAIEVMTGRSLLPAPKTADRKSIW